MSAVMERPGTVPLKPPAPTARAVLVHRKKLEAERDALQAGAAELALKSARGDVSAQAALAAMPGKQAGLQFEIDQNRAAYELAVKHDQGADADWRASLQLMAPEDLIAGINRDECCHLCQPGSFCVITAGFPYAGGQCGHPVREQPVIFGRDAAGDRKFFYAHNPQAARVFEAARLKLKVPTR